MKEKLTLNDLCGYLPFDLQFEAPVLIWTGNPPEPSHDEIGQVTMTTSNMEQLINHGTPIFRNLATDLTREIEHNGEKINFIESILKELNKEESFEEWTWSIDGYFEQGSCDTFQMISCGNDNTPLWLAEKLRFYHFWLGDQSYFEKKIILDYNDVNGL